MDFQLGIAGDEFSCDNIVLVEAGHEDMSSAQPCVVVDDVECTVGRLDAVGIGDGVVGSHVQEEFVGPGLAVVVGEESGHFFPFCVGVVVDEEEPT